jgi:hypothetical protein
LINEKSIVVSTSSTKFSALAFKENLKGLPSTFDWYTKKRVFGKNGFPWSNPSYHGDPNIVYEIPQCH